MLVTFQCRVTRMLVLRSHPFSFCPSAILVYQSLLSGTGFRSLEIWDTEKKRHNRKKNSTKTTTEIAQILQKKTEHWYGIYLCTLWVVVATVLMSLVLVFVCEPHAHTDPSHISKQNEMRTRKINPTTWETANRISQVYGWEYSPWCRLVFSAKSNICAHVLAI